MADIRYSPERDDFSGAFQDPIQSPWVKADAASWAANMWRNGSGSMIGKGGDSKYALTTVTMSGDMEVWGRPIISADITEGWRMALLKDVGSSGACDGYSTRVAWNIGSETVTINRMTNGGFTGLANVDVTGLMGNAPPFFDFRLEGDQVEMWHGTDADNWFILASVTDSTYRENLHPCLGASSDDGTGPGWTAMGGGMKRRRIPQIYRRPNE